MYFLALRLDLLYFPFTLRLNAKKTRLKNKVFGALPHF